MINDDFNFSFESSDFPVSIEEFAAYMDGNLTDDEMQRVLSVTENDETMQGVMDSMEQSELILAEYGQEDMQLPKEIADGEFDLPETDNHHVGGGGFFNPFSAVAACVASPIIFNQAFMLNEEDFSEASNNYFEEADNSYDNESGNHSDINEDNPRNN